MTVSSPYHHGINRIGRNISCRWKALYSLQQPANGLYIYKYIRPVWSREIICFSSQMVHPELLNVLPITAKVKSQTLAGISRFWFRILFVFCFFCSLVALFAICSIKNVWRLPPGCKNCRLCKRCCKRDNHSCTHLDNSLSSKPRLGWDWKLKLIETF